MSWKSLVTAGLLCALASPAFAAPTVSAVGGGNQASAHLDASGNWVWTVRLSQSSPIVDIDDAGPIPAGSPLAAELGFTATDNNGTSAIELISATKNATDFDDDNPGNVIFGWETLTPLGGTGACDSATPGSCPVGLQTSLVNDQVFSALGSVDYLGDADGKDYITITTNGPSTTAANALATTTITMRGTYGAGNDKGRIAELNDAYDGDGTPPISLNYDTYAGAVTRQAKAGDVNLDGTISSGDFGVLQTNFSINDGNRQWFHGDFNGDGDVSAGDFGFLQTNFGPANNYTVYSDSNFASGAGGGGAVPEPATIAMLALAGLGLAGIRRR